jgi:AcrR family transcriptional regulator
MAKQSRSAPVMKMVLDAVAERLMAGDELLIRIPEICKATGVNYGSVYHHFGSREGVIDAAYNMIFTQMVEQDLALFSDPTTVIDSKDAYEKVTMPLISMLQMGPERRASRALRVRIVAAASTRPELAELIAQSQARLTNEWKQLIEYAQEQEWLRSDIDPGFLAAFLQIIVFGRSLDDASASPLDEQVWGDSVAKLFVETLLK